MTPKTALIIIATTNVLDAATTYIILERGGREINPIIADLVNSNPPVIFLIHAVVTAVIAVLLFTAEYISKRLPVHINKTIWKFFDRLFVASVFFKSIILINNALGVAVGVTPIANLFVDT